MRSRRNTCPGLTLLEAVVALAILAGVLMVSLQIRARSIAVERDVHSKLAAHLAAETILAKLDAGILPEPMTDPETGARRWEGEHADHSFTLTRRAIKVANPGFGGAGADDAPSITMWRYTLGYRGAEIAFLHDH